MHFVLLNQIWGGGRCSYQRHVLGWLMTFDCEREQVMK